MSSDIRRRCYSCRLCQLGKQLKRKYGKLPKRDLKSRPCHTVCVDCVGLYTVRIKTDRKKVQKQTVRVLTMVDPATGWFEMGEIPEGDFNSKRVSQLMNQYWLSRYPRPVKCICDNGSEFKKDIPRLIKDFGIKYKPVKVVNPQANAIVERIHGVVNDML